MEVTDYAFFPTRVVTIQFPDTDPLNAELCDLFDRRPELDDRSNTHPEALNLLRLADTVPAIEQLRSMFITGVKHWLETEGIAGPEGIDLLLFSNRMGRGESTIVHNHNTDLIGIYYAQTAVSNRHPIQPADDEDYFEAGDGVLVLHDPRFNANLTSVCQRDHIKVIPRPGLMLIFPAYVWHSVTSHRGEFHRLSFAMNFTLR
ncbi:MAG: putative 2OG-Fe(II) oxygenase, partial [Planctomycetota bacterium]